ncbi:hypothetical protein MCUN1_003415 [Malassezia cuniculi]|uniref:Calcineurin-like phosphoesterase domain-containing protein n=1 Tax=Malassezia cuniculi TaxID=948313 RepID=A0AAF0F1C5_9BASI|nr:hypothetical protein MCUN1_003415 [Malassezia cuniculi]
MSPGDELERQPLTDPDAHPTKERPLSIMVKVSIALICTVFALGVCLPSLAATPSAAITTKAGTAVYTAPLAFPTDKFKSMYWTPQRQEGEPQPVIPDLNGGDFADELNDPNKLPEAPPASEAAMPSPTGKRPGSRTQLYNDTIKNISAIIEDASMSACDRCVAAVKAGQHVARVEPEIVPDIMTDLCIKYKYITKPSVDIGCKKTFLPQVLGGSYTQVLSYAVFDGDSKDAEYICSLKLGKCPVPRMDVLTDDFLNTWFNGQRDEPENVTSRSPKTGEKSDKNLRALHLSDIHVDARYVVGSEGDCDSGQCCRADSFNTTLWNQPTFAPGTLPKENISHPASYWGYYHCDPSWALVAATMQAVESVAGKDGFDFGVFTGDIATHDAHWHLSRDLVRYSEQAVMDVVKSAIADAPMVIALGNHDSAPTDLAAPHSLPDGNGNQLSWDWDYVAKALSHEGWVNETVAEVVRTHYGGYSVSPRAGLRAIAINTDFWYNGNVLNYINTSNPDMSGMLRWLTDELQAAEDAHERVWIVGHVLSGWNGRNSFPNPSNLFSHIVTRYRSTIAHIFFGHTHEDEFQLFYHTRDGNSTDVSRKTKDVVAHAFIGPSVTPSNNVNPSFRVYSVDPETYEVLDYDQYYTPLNVNEKLSDSSHGPVWHKLYSAREVYANLTAISNANAYSGQVELDNGWWPKDAPLNATFWASVTDEMEKRTELITLQQTLQGRNSIRSPPCTTDECFQAKVCYMRSSTSELGRSCPGNGAFGSVQS